MKKTKWLFPILLVFMMLFASACTQAPATEEPAAQPEATQEATSAPETSSEAPVTITFLNSKNDINDQLTAAIAEFSKSYPYITINVISTDQSPVERATTLYASGTPATLCMLDAGDIAKFKDKAADLSNEKWVADLAQPNLLDGKTIAFPFAVEGYGLLYNKAVVEKALGGSFDPATITTRTALEELFVKIQDSGVSPIAIGSMDWSLGNHFLALAYADQPDGDVQKFIDSLKAGTADLVNNAAFNGLMDTFDMMLKYNMGKDDPMAISYETSVDPVAQGEAAFTFQGNWAMMEIQKFNTDGEFGFLPVPISDDPTAKTNTSMAIGATKQVFIDNTVSTPEQQAAAKLFLDWIVYDAAGQDFLVNKANIVAGFKNVELTPANPLAASLKDYNNSGRSIAFAGNFVPADHWSVLGASMQKYMVGQITRAELAADVESYWKTVE